MTAPEFEGDDRYFSPQIQTSGRNLGRRRARRLCQRFAQVGVEARPERLQEMLAGLPAANRELTDISFALIASELNRAARTAKFKRLKQRGVRSLMFTGVVLAVLHLLICMAYVLVNLLQQT